MVFLTVADLVGAVVGIVLTLLVFSYLLGDNLGFRFAIHLFVGVSAGLAGAVALRTVILPHILLPLIDFSDLGAWFQAFVLLVLSVLLLAKLSPRLGLLGNLPMAYIVGVGAAVVLSGAVMGTIFPQVSAASDLIDLRTLPADTPLASLGGLVNRVIAVLGTIGTLAYFHFSARSVPNAPPVRPDWIEYLARIGQVFLAVTLGALFAGVFSAALAAWVERWNFIVDFLTTIASALL
ncbi:MAG TPA: hypothetical protein VMN57_10960 [Anaerolineales bacterium]|nr:hypothetical protein [Anaerolineales bacterium]